MIIMCLVAEGGGGEGGSFEWIPIGSFVLGSKTNAGEPLLVTSDVGIMIILTENNDHTHRE